MGYLEMGISQRAWEIAMVIQGQVGYETPIQWRIAKELALREEMMLAARPVPEDVEARKQLNETLQSLNKIANGISSLQRWKPVSRKTMVLMYNEAIGAPEPQPVFKWWQYRPLNGKKASSGERFALIWMAVAIAFNITSILTRIFAK